MAGYQPSLVALLIAFVAFALIGYESPSSQIARLDVYWDICRYLRCSCSFPDLPGPLGYAELDIHKEGYTLRIEPYVDIDIERQAGTLDTSLLAAFVAVLRLDAAQYHRLFVYVESSLPLDDYIRTVDKLRALDTEPYLRFEEPPSRALCMEPLGCVPIPEPHSPG